MPLGGIDRQFGQVLDEVLGVDMKTRLLRGGLLRHMSKERSNVGKPLVSIRFLTRYKFSNDSLSDRTPVFGLPIRV